MAKKEPAAFRVQFLSIQSNQAEIDEVRSHVLAWIDGQDENALLDLSMRCGQALVPDGKIRFTQEELPLLCLLAWAGGTLARLHQIENQRQNFEGN